MSKGKSICVKVYLKPEVFAEIAKLAEKAGKRRGGLLLYTQKAHGFAGETLANTDGIAKAFKFWAFYWKEDEAARLEKARDIAEKEKALAKEKEKLGRI